ncbi:MAG TPA: WD40 repeat domain-containing protein [Gemmataceae bacterium]|nr:WD40 repeat domain-containing protein [Gemmataceae bacterium]
MTAAKPAASPAPDSSVRREPPRLRGAAAEGEKAERPRKQTKKKSEDSSDRGNMKVLVLGGVGVLVVVLLAAGAVFYLNRKTEPDQASAPPVKLQTKPKNPETDQTNKPLDTKPQSKAKPTAKQLKEVPRVPSPTELAKLAYVQELVFAPDGKLLATIQFFSGRAHYALQIWDLASGKELLKLHEGNDSVEQIFFSPDGQFLACFFFHHSKVKVWEVSSGKLTQTFKAPPNTVFGDRLLGFSPDSKAAFAAADKNVYRLNIEDGQAQMLERIQVNSDHRMAAMPTAPFIALAGKSLFLLDEMNGLGKSVCPLSGATTQMAFSGDGKTLAVCYVEGHIDIIDTESWTLKTTQRREKSEGFTDYLRFSLNRDGKYLVGVPDLDPKAFGDDERRAELWDVASGDMRKLTLGLFSQIVFSPDGNTLAVAQSNSYLRFLDAKTGKPGEGSKNP